MRVSYDELCDTIERVSYTWDDQLTWQAKIDLICFECGWTREEFDKVCDSYNAMIES